MQSEKVGGAKAYKVKKGSESLSGIFTKNGLIELVENGVMLEFSDVDVSTLNSKNKYNVFFKYDEIYNQEEGHAFELTKDVTVYAQSEAEAEAIFYKNLEICNRENITHFSICLDD